MIVTVPIRTGRGLNDREHWRTRSRRVKAEKDAVLAMLIRMPKCMRYVINLTRISPGTLDGDNLQGALKAVRDAVAIRLGMDDASPMLTWHYAQERGKEFAVRIEIDGVK